MKQQVKEGETKIPEPQPENKYWENIAKDIWNDYDILSLFIESHLDQLKEQGLFPFFEKLLYNRFKYFVNSHGRTLTREEYAKEQDGQRRLMDLMIEK